MWEAVWIAAGRRGVAADFLKGLIKLAAAGVKCREGSRAGVQRHARRAEQLFRSVRDATGAAFYFGLRMEELLQFTDIAALTTADAASDGRPQVVFAFRLLPR